MKRLLLLMLGLTGCFGARAQAAGLLARQYAAAIVSLEATPADGRPEAGSGFVVGATADSVYIVTAGHVLQNARAAVLVRLAGWPQPLPARVLFFAYAPPEDLALLAVAARQFRWQRYSTRAGLSAKDSLCFIRSKPVVRADNTLASEHTLLPTNSDAYMLGTNQEEHSIHLVLPGIAGGDSGSALLLGGLPFCVVGMITYTNRATSIAHIKEVLLPRLGSKWQLTELPFLTD